MKKYIGLSMSIVTFALLASGCGAESEKDANIQNTRQVKGKITLNSKKNIKNQDQENSCQVDNKQEATVYQPKNISFKSNCDYNKNKYGVITASTLTKWLNNWQENKPEGVNGRLVVLQAGAVSFDHNRTFLPHNDKDVLVYGIPGGGACDPSYKRFDGSSQTPGAMVAGENIDGNINFFQVDPEKDFVVVTVAEGSNTIREIVRTWWSMIYWGWDMKKIAFLNGSVAYNYACNKDYLVAQPSPLPKIENEYHMSSLKTDRTALHIYIDEMKDIAKKDDKSGYFILDARGTKEYTGVKLSKTASKVCGEDHNASCVSAFKGHIRGAVDFPYTEILVTDDAKMDLNGDCKIDKKDASFKFKSLHQLQTLYANKGYKDGDTVLAYCRTGRKSTLSALTSVVVLGYPYRMYDGSWIQWGMMAHSRDVNCSYILPKCSKLRTDTDEYSVVLGYNNHIDIEPRTFYDINLKATTSQNILKEDKAYLNK